MNDRKNSTILYGHIMLYIIRFVNIVLLFSGNKIFFHFLSFYLINFFSHLCIQSYFSLHVLSQGITPYLAL